MRNRRAQLAAILAADTGLGLQQWELKMFLAEFDLTDNRVTADKFCSIYSYLASRPPTPAAKDAPAVVAAAAAAPASDPAPAAAAAAAAATAAESPASNVAVDPALAKRASEKLSGPAAAAVASMGATFPPDFLLDPAGAIPAEKLLANLPGDVYVDADAKFRPFDGVGQYAKMPILGGCGAPYSVCVKSSREYLRDLPPARDVVRALHLRPSDDAFVPHPNEISCVLLAFAKLVCADLGLGGDLLAANNPMSSYLDLQVLYGTNAGECDDVRGGEPRGKILPDAAAGRGHVGGGAATEALLTVFSRNHNDLAERIAAEKKDADDDAVFQMARHANIACYRSVFLKDFVPYLAAGQHTPDVMPIADAARGNVRGVNGCVEMDLLMRTFNAMEPPGGVVEGDGTGDACAAALFEASRVRCGLVARCNLPGGLHAEEVAAVKRARASGVCTLNEFRAQLGLAAWESFEEMTGGETSLCDKLTEVYGDVDNCELYTGLLCEYNVGNVGAMMPATSHACSLLLNVVAADKWFQEDVLRDESVMGGAVGVGIAEKANLADLLMQHAGVAVPEGGESPFEIGVPELVSRTSE